MVALFLLTFVPGGVRLAVYHSANRAKDWLPASYPESVDLDWFHDHFSSAQFVLVSWDGCTLADENGRLQLLANKLSQEKNDRGQRLFRDILTGPQMIERLSQSPSNLTTATAVERLDGALVGPVLVNAEGEPLPETMRTTCLVASLTEYTVDSNRRMREAIEVIQRIATVECGVPLADLRMGGPPVDNVTIDIQGKTSLRRLALLSGVVGFAIAFFSLRSWKMTLAVLSAAVISASACLAMVYWFGVIEVTLFGMPTPRLGKLDAILNTMPAVVYVLGISGAIHVVNYYREERAERGLAGAVERGVRISWGPCLLAAVTTAVGLASLGTSDIVPVEKFGVMTAIGVLMTVVVLFTILPVMLHLFADKHLPQRPSDRKASALPGWAIHFFGIVTHRHGLVSTGCVALMLLMALGLPKIIPSVEILKLLDEDLDLIHDYAWLEENLGNLVPVEVVIAVDSDQQRGPDERAETPDSDRYRMTIVERMQLTDRIMQRVESIEEVSRALSASSFRPERTSDGGATLRRATDYTINKALEDPHNQNALADYLRPEILPAGQQGPPRQLWRVSARVAALADVDYGCFLDEIRTQVEPVLAAYRGRDQLIAKLHQQGQQLTEARIAVAYHAPKDSAEAKQSAAVELYRLLRNTDSRHLTTPLNTVALDQTKSDHVAKLQQFDAIVTLNDATSDSLLIGQGLTNLVSLSEVPNLAAGQQNANSFNYASTYTGIVPLVYKTQGELLVSLRESIIGAAVLIGVVMIVLLRSVVAGVVSMLPNVFPLVVVFGALGWLGFKVDIGIMMTASVALGVAVDDTIHFLTWFRRGMAQGLDRRGSTLLAYDRCAIAMTQTTLVAGLGLMVFAISTFTPSQQFGYMMVTMLTAALLGDLLLLPALLCGPLGRFFVPRMAAEAGSVLAEQEQQEGGEEEGGIEPQPVPDPAPPHALATPQQGGAEDSQPAVTDRVDAPVGAEESLSTPNAALVAKLRRFRRV